MDKLYLNELLQDIRENSKNEVLRIIWISYDYTRCFLIDIFDKKALPEERSIEEVELLLKNNTYIILSIDSKAEVVNPEKISEVDKNIMERGWKIINLIANKKNEPDIFNKRNRGILVKKAIAEFKVDKKTVYKNLRKFWQGGKVKYALLPQYGLNRNNSRRVTKKVGRKSKIAKMYANANKNYPEIITDENLIKIYKKAIKKWYKKHKCITLSQVYNFMKTKFFVDKKTGLPFPQNLIPSERQFRYWYKHYGDHLEDTKARLGEKKYLEDKRPIESNCISEVNGPGSRLQLDSTVQEVNFVNRLDRSQVIGRPRTYLLIDVFSELIAGFCVAIENASYNTQIMALVNMAEDKVPYCKGFDINITKDEWPFEALPVSLLGDNGEFKSKYCELLTNNYGIEVENTPSYRADLKPLVERLFGKVKHDINDLLDGVSKKEGERKRGEKDNRINACIDIYQYTKIMINAILFINNNYWIKDYQRNTEMIKDKVKPIPVELYKWGIKKQSGQLRKVDKDLFRISILPTSNVSISREGIYFKKMYYTSDDEAINISIIKAGLTGHVIPITIHYDPRNITYIYIYYNKEHKAIKCYLTEKYERYKGMSLDEVKALQEQEQLEQDMFMDTFNKGQYKFINDINKINIEARKQTNEYLNKENKKKRIKNIRESREKEKNAIRKEDSILSNYEATDDFKLDKSENIIEDETENKVLDIMDQIVRKEYE